MALTVLGATLNPEQEKNVRTLNPTGTATAVKTGTTVKETVPPAPPQPWTGVAAPGTPEAAAAQQTFAGVKAADAAAAAAAASAAAKAKTDAVAAKVQNLMGGNGAAYPAIPATGTVTQDPEAAKRNQIWLLQQRGQDIMYGKADPETGDRPGYLGNQTAVAPSAAVAASMPPQVAPTEPQPAAPAAPATAAASVPPTITTAVDESWKFTGPTQDSTKTMWTPEFKKAMDSRGLDAATRNDLAKLDNPEQYLTASGVDRAAISKALAAAEELNIQRRNTEASSMSFEDFKNSPEQKQRAREVYGAYNAAVRDAKSKRGGMFFPVSRESIDNFEEQQRKAWEGQSEARAAKKQDVEIARYNAETARKGVNVQESLGMARLGLDRDALDKKTQLEYDQIKAASALEDQRAGHTMEQIAARGDIEKELARQARGTELMKQVRALNSAEGMHAATLLNNLAVAKEQSASHIAALVKAAELGADREDDSAGAAVSKIMGDIKSEVYKSGNPIAIEKWKADEKATEESLRSFGNSMRWQRKAERLAAPGTQPVKWPDGSWKYIDKNGVTQTVGVVSAPKG